MLNTLTKKATRVCAAIGLAYSAAMPFAQAVVAADIEFTFDTPSSIDQWQLVYTSETAVGADTLYQEGHIAFVPHWQQPEEFMGYATDLGAAYDFSAATITADVMYSGEYYATGEQGLTDYLAGTSVILIDDQGRLATTQLWGPWGGAAGAFSHYRYLDESGILAEVDAGFDITKIRQLGIKLNSLGQLPMSPGVIALDNISVDLDGAIQNTGDPTFIDFPIASFHWMYNINAASSYYWNAEEKYSNLRIFYQDSETFGEDEKITHTFLWSPNLTAARMKFALTLPSTFEGLAGGIRIALVDNQERIAVLAELDKSQLVYGQAMDFRFTDILLSNFLYADEGFNLSLVSRFSVDIDLPDSSVMLDGVLSITGFNLQVKSRYPRNQENPKKAQKIHVRDMGVFMEYLNWDDQNESTYSVEWVPGEIKITPFWQDFEAKLGINNYWFQNPVNLKNATLKQRVFIPEAAVGTGMRLELTLSDPFMWPPITVPVAVLDWTVSPGWNEFEFELNTLEGQLDLRIIEQYEIALTREHMLGDVGTFRFKAPRFEYQ